MTSKRVSRQKYVAQPLLAVLHTRQRLCHGGHRQECLCHTRNSRGRPCHVQIRQHIGSRFRGHELARLVSEMLTAQGYRIQLSPPGPDGGTDIIAGRGPMGFDSPRLCVQVKSSDSPVDVKILRELQGVLQNYTAEQGLLVAWGGFTNSAISEAKQRFFQVRLWDAGDLVTAILQHYDRLSADIQAELPLKRIWALVPGEQEGGD